MESTLTIKFHELEARVGSFLGWGLGKNYSDTAWTAKQQFEIDGVVASGLAQFWRPVLENGQGYDWSFLRPSVTATFASGDSTVPLPDDFGGFEGRIALAETTSQPWPIEWRNEGIIRALYAVNPLTTGAPQFAVETPLRGTDLKNASRSELLIWPIADRDYTLRFQYYVNPDYLSGTKPYAYGATEHWDTILESCLSIAEQRLDDATTVHSMKFRERLVASVNADRRHKPQKLGQNRDRSDDLPLGYSPQIPATLYNGAAFE